MRSGAGTGWALGGLVIALGLGIGASGWAPAAPDKGAAPHRVATSFFALGDTGTSGWLHRGQQHVAEALAELDRSRPADGLLLLGDNFYPDGLHREEAERRLLDNVILPYCQFVDLTPLWTQPPACAQQERGVGRTIWAVHGNHDEGAETVALQRDWIPTRIRNWTMPRQNVRLYELTGGLSLITFESQPLMEGRALPSLSRALREAQGPWRVVASHRPLRFDGERPAVSAASARVRSAIAAAEVPVQLALAGHEHNLQVLDLEEPGLGLQVVAGSGSRWRRITAGASERLLGVDALGFVRVDLTEAPEPRLVVALYSVSAAPFRSSWPLPWRARLTREAVFEIDVEGRFERRAEDT